ncbi:MULTISPECIES: tryptophanase leader peptide [Plesiomonas]|uniref:Tryptophanase leader peptide n=1 Tax=Plesiomonas shigelloides TaxID=703 RepID=A0A8E0W2D3_PLESH|nr:tryptophanase leader peptide [Plesiomonas shigelloides]MCX9457563.1 tryptophanase leader peptide [Vibrio cholerae]KAB7660939.1 tryptophanase leader peptide [Plesiomonas shigelloides]KAB7666741.1 tryptophanase leader peptide [Plesiomonas shigelloides]KAB7677672.1 tryptophanase leader peptide [Plesiomonas shigelloides]
MANSNQSKSWVTLDHKIAFFIPAA